MKMANHKRMAKSCWLIFWPGAHSLIGEQRRQEPEWKPIVRVRFYLPHEQNLDGQVVCLATLQTSEFQGQQMVLCQVALTLSAEVLRIQPILPELPNLLGSLCRQVLGSLCRQVKTTASKLDTSQLLPFPVQRLILTLGCAIVSFSCESDTWKRVLNQRTDCITLTFGQVYGHFLNYC